MPTRFNRYRTSKFIEWSPLVALSALGLLGAAALLSPLISYQLVEKNIEIFPTKPVEVTSIQPQSVEIASIQPQWNPIGAVSIRVIANLPDNTWCKTEIWLFDEQGKLIDSAKKEFWKESGKWTENDEWGTWQEEDQVARLDIRRITIKSPVMIAIALLEQGTTSGKPLDQPISFHVDIEDRVVDKRLLLFFSIAVLPILVALAVFSVKNAGRILISESTQENKVGGGGRLGSSDELIRVIIKVLTDETAPKTISAKLSITDNDGNTVYQDKLSINLRRKRKFFRLKSQIYSYRGKYILNLILDFKSTYKFHLEVLPADCIDEIYLTVKQSIRTLSSIDLFHIYPPTN